MISLCLPPNPPKLIYPHTRNLYVICSTLHKQHMNFNWACRYKDVMRLREDDIITIVHHCKTIDYGKTRGKTKVKLG